VSELLAIGVSHKTAPVEVRERVALTNARVAEFVRDLRGTGEVHEAVTISTCNRTELYVVVGNPVEAESRALGMLASQAAPPSSLPRSTRCATATPRAICTASPRVSIR
jgi:glutamyl-tRNA reductase